MKVKVRYETTAMEYDVAEEECRSMVEADYVGRKERAQEGEEVSRRPIQEIFDDLANKPERYAHRKYRKHTASLDAYDPKGDKLVIDEEQYTSLMEKIDLRIALKAAVAKLQPQQQELVYRVYCLGESQAEIARELGVSRTAINNRLSKIHSQLKKQFENNMLQGG